MADTPHITIAHHPQASVVAAPSHDHHVTDHLLRRVGFEPVPDSRLYTLCEPERDPVRRTQLAVQSLRAARQSVSADAAYDLQPGEPLPSPLGSEKQPPHTPVPSAQRRAQAALAISPARAQTAAGARPSPTQPAYRTTPAATPHPARTR
ncbi:hypothetical protein [Streptomyces smyrnaeus]|uniref:hypothetical protein n=1 Tax=Streptomyces smyrnaeus TaxID=1387713 RepID=UPI00369DC529